MTIMEAWLLLLLINIFVTAMVVIWRATYDVSSEVTSYTERAANWLNKRSR